MTHIQHVKKDIATLKETITVSKHKYGRKNESIAFMILVMIECKNEFSASMKAQKVKRVKMMISDNAKLRKRINHLSEKLASLEAELKAAQI